MIPKHIFCQCMKPWSICASKKNSYKLDVRDLITPTEKKNETHLNYDFINRKTLKDDFVCRFSDKKTKSS
jgi:hypothetical protein